MFEDLIEMLLQKKAALRDELEREFAKKTDAIDRMLMLAGYAEPAETVETEAVEEPVENANAAEGDLPFPNVTPAV